MPRAHRRRSQPPSDDSLDRFLAGFARAETRRGGEWTVQPVSARRAQKVYRCPGCGRDIAPGIAHVVTWRADGVLGDAADLAARRHWHTGCWRTA
ncbi:MAG: hypothetical protein QM611_05925 [Microbacterium sp.]|uniref:hypothetical protein n=1 Tax=Microbacterium sp. TaxID=51671 RepID=UPI0039E72AEA